MKKITLIILILVAVTFAGLVQQGGVSGKNNKLATISGSTNEQKLRRAELAIKGMWCASCSTGAEYSLKAIEGVIDAYVSFTDSLDGTGWVIYEDGRVRGEQIIQAIQPYEARIISDRPYTK